MVRILITRKNERTTYNFIATVKVSGLCYLCSEYENLCVVVFASVTRT